MRRPGLRSLRSPRPAPEALRLSRCRGEPAPRDARLVRVRARNRPGRLAAVTGRLAEFGVDVIRVEVLNGEAGWALDDHLLTGRRLDDALARLGRTAACSPTPPRRPSRPGDPDGERVRRSGPVAA